MSAPDRSIDPAQLVGLREGDAHVIHDAGGRASDDAIRSLVMSHELLLDPVEAGRLVEVPEPTRAGRAGRSLVPGGGTNGAQWLSLFVARRAGVPCFLAMSSA